MASPLRVTVAFPKPWLSVEIENQCLLCPISDLKIVIPGIVEKLVTELLNPGASFSSLIELPTHEPRLFVEWRLPMAPKCSRSFDIPSGSKEPPSHPIHLNLRDIPRLGHTYEPFQVTISLENHTGEVLTGEILVGTENRSLMVYGKNPIQFSDFAPHSELTFLADFVAIIEGDFMFPSFAFEVRNRSKFVISPTEGILIVGNSS
jgi:hypothetical protein